MIFKQRLILLLQHCDLLTFWLIKHVCLHLPPEENGALHQHGARAEEVATAKIQAEPAEEMRAVDIGTAAHDKDLVLGVSTRRLGCSDVVLL